MTDPLVSGGGWSAMDDEPLVSAADHPFDAAEPGRYVLGGLLGSGGFGEVWLARDTRLDRDVALKILRPGSDAARAALLAREARLTARLQHPGIVTAHDAGRDARGRLYYTMAVVDGQSLDALLPTGSPPRLVRHLRDAAEAVAYAHAQGVLHRDLKPANIVVERFGATQVVDWGLAVDAHSEPERLRGRVGTPGFMAPEQEAGAVVGPAADVFSLGRVLGTIAGDVPELVAIAARATEPDPTARYADAEAFAAELDAWLTGRRVLAHDYSALELLRRFLVAWRVPLAVAGLAALLLVVGGVASFLRIRDARDAALTAQATAEDALARADVSLSRLLTDRATEELARNELSAARTLALRALVAAPSPTARGVLAATGTMDPAALVGTIPLGCRPNVGGRCIEDARAATAVGDSVLVLRATGAAELRRPGSTEAIDGSFAALDAGGGRALLHNGRSLVLFDGADRQTSSPCAGRAPTADGLAIRATAVDAERLVVLCRDGSLLVQTSASSVRHPTPFDGRLAAPRATALQGDLLAVADHDGAIATLSVTSGEVLSELRIEAPVRALALRPASSQLAVVHEGGGVRLADVHAGTWVGALPPGDARDARYVDGRLVVLSGDAEATWAVPEVLVPHRIGGDAGLTAADFGPNASLLTSRGDGGLALHAPARPRRVVRWQDNVVKPGALSPDGARYAASGVADASVRVLDALTLESVSRIDGFALRRVAWSGDLLVGLAMRAGGLHVWRDGEAIASHPGRWVAVDHGVRGLRHVLDADGRIARLHADGRLETIATLPGAGALDVDGGLIVVARGDEVVLLGLDGGQRGLITSPGPVLDVAVRSGRIATAGLDGVRIVTREGALEAVLPGHADRVSSVRFDAEGQSLLTGSWDGSARRWHLDALHADPAALLARQAQAP